MSSSSRRAFFHSGLGSAAGLAAAPRSLRAAEPLPPATASLSLDGEWDFSLDQQSWRTVRVPHTWQVEPALSAHLGKAWYRRRFDAPPAWRDGAVRLEFESVFHSARVFINGRSAGDHLGKGYTAFTLDITNLLDYGHPNTLLVETDNAFSPSMLPRNNSYDWTPDGGIYRPVWLHVTPALYIERVEIDAAPDASSPSASASVRAILVNRSPRTARLTLEAEFLDDASSLSVARCATATEIPAGASQAVPLPTARIESPRLWHFDHPHLYRLRLTAGAHSHEETFGIRRFETRDGGFYLNGERVRLMGVERMAGSHPQYGMAEPFHWLEHDHRDMQELNCVFTRVHWMQDRRLLDWCDRHGMLIQLEVPTWGPATWAGMTSDPDPALLSNGLEQLREMIAQNRNHPSVFAWGLCNEIGGHRPPAKKFAQALYQEARRLDPNRLRSYASNTLHSETALDVAGEMDFLEWNEYYESWYGGNPETLRQSLAIIRAAYPGKAIVISEYGLCECDPKNPTSDARRIEILRTHDEIYRREPNVAGLIFFCYNDYRTHMGDKGVGALRQRVHGVVDLYGNRKPSYDVLRRESSPVASLSLSRDGQTWRAALATRDTVPAYTLRGYSLRFTLYGFGGLPMEQQLATLPDLRPGAHTTAEAAFKDPNPARVTVEIVRPTGPSTLSAEWRP